MKLVKCTLCNRIVMVIGPFGKMLRQMMQDPHRKISSVFCHGSGFPCCSGVQLRVRIGRRNPQKSFQRIARSARHPGSLAAGSPWGREWTRQKMTFPPARRVEGSTACERMKALETFLPVLKNETDPVNPKQPQMAPSPFVYETKPGQLNVPDKATWQELRPGVSAKRPGAFGELMLGRWVSRDPKSDVITQGAQLNWSILSVCVCVCHNMYICCSSTVG